ncbi:MAG: PA2169 family four-helix-bundle protein [Rhodanobacteraceae bacterium]
MNNVDAITLMNRLIVTSKNGESALRAASEEAYHEDLKQSLLGYSRFLGEAAHDLQEAVRRLGGKPQELGTFGNTLHRTWMHLTVTALGRDEDEILDQVEPDEATAEKRLAEAVTWETPPEVHALLERQYENARKHHSEIRELRERLHTVH